MTEEEYAKLPHEFIRDTYTFRGNHMFESNIKLTLDYFKGKLNTKQTILDIGGRGPLVDEIEAAFGVKIDSTDGDLDVGFQIPDKKYDVVIYSHTIEHQFNPLFTLLRIEEVMKPDGRLYIMLPERGKMLWANGHYHEIDEYRMRILLRRADLEVESKIRQKVWRTWYSYFLGFRPFLRLFLEYHAVYCVKKK
jgi:SAM-dependent methyltransferase